MYWNQTRKGDEMRRKKTQNWCAASASECAQFSWKLSMIALRRKRESQNTNGIISWNSKCWVKIAWLTIQFRCCWWDSNHNQNRSNEPLHFVQFVICSDEFVRQRIDIVLCTAQATATNWPLQFSLNSFTSNVQNTKTNWNLLLYLDNAHWMENDRRESRQY